MPALAPFLLAQSGVMSFMDDSETELLNNGIAKEGSGFIKWKFRFFYLFELEQFGSTSFIRITVICSKNWMLLKTPDFLKASWNQYENDLNEFSAQNSM